MRKEAGLLKNDFTLRDNVSLEKVNLKAIIRKDIKFKTNKPIESFEKYNIGKYIKPAPSEP